MTSFVTSFVESQRRSAEANGRKLRRRRRPARQLVPRGIERQFRSELFELLADVRKPIVERLIPALPFIVAQAGTRKTADRADIEDVSGLIESIVGPVRLVLSNTSTRRAEAIAVKYFNATSDFSRRQLSKVMRSALGVDAFPSDEGLRAFMNSFRRENVSLISDLPRNYVDTISDIVQREVRAGTRASAIERMIVDQFPRARNRARLIARDQVNKINGQLTRLRQTNLGIEQYIWRTSRDERVRSSHLALEGKKFNWDDPPEVGHPGQDINCRCTAEPVVPGITEEDTAAERKRVRREVERKKKALKKA